MTDTAFDSALTLSRDDLRESMIYLKWALAKRRTDTFQEHEVFFDALIDELESVVSLLDWSGPISRRSDNES
jgi:hypothetical protein